MGIKLCVEFKSIVHYKATQLIETDFKVHWGYPNYVILKGHEAAGGKYDKMLITFNQRDYG